MISGVEIIAGVDTQLDKTYAGPELSAHRARLSDVAGLGRDSTRHGAHGPGDVVPGPPPDRQRHALVARRHGQAWTNQTFRETFPTDPRDAHLELTGLVDTDVATAEDEHGGRVYRIAEPPKDEQPANPPVKAPVLPGTGPVAGTGLTARQVQDTLQQLRDAGVVTLIGSPGKRESRYERRT